MTCLRSQMWSQSKDLHLDDHPRAATKLREIMVTRLLLAAAALSCAAPGAAFMGNAPSFGLRRASVSQRAGACSLRAQAQVGETVLGRRDVLKAPVAASLELQSLSPQARRLFVPKIHWTVRSSCLARVGAPVQLVSNIAPSRRRSRAALSAVRPSRAREKRLPSPRSTHLCSL